MKKILIFLVVLLMGVTAKAQTYSLDNSTRLIFSGDSLMVSSAIEGIPSIGYHNGNTFYCLSFMWNGETKRYYILKSCVNPNLREGLEKEVCIRIGRKEKEYYLNRMLSTTINNWLNHDKRDFGTSQRHK